MCVNGHQTDNLSCEFKIFVAENFNKLHTKKMDRKVYYLKIFIFHISKERDLMAPHWNCI